MPRAVKAQGSPSRFGDEEIEQAWPDLTFWYGLSPRELAEMPRALRDVYAASLPRLIAEYRSYAIQAATMPYLKEAAQRSAWNALKKQMRRWRPSRKAPSEEEYFGAVAAVGFNIIMPGDEAAAPSLPPKEDASAAG